MNFNFRSLSIGVLCLILSGCSGQVGTGAKLNSETAAPPQFSLSPPAGAVMINTTFQFAGANGKAPYSFHTLSCLGTIDQTTGLFHAGNTAEVCTVVVSDANQQSVTGTVTITTTPPPPVHGYAYLATNLFSQCVGCHGGSSYGSYSALISTGQIVPNNPAGSTLYSIVFAGRMPPGGVSQALIQDLNAWIQAGAPNN